MSLMPYLFNELLQNAYDPFSHLHDQNFGVGILNDEVFRQPALVPNVRGYLYPRYSSLEKSGTSTVSNEKDKFKVNLDVQQFKPEEINVKVVDDYLVVEGNHEERQDKHGFISRQFTRRYKLPQNVNMEAIASSLSSDGVLSITAPKKLEKNAKKEIEIPVIRTNAPAIKQTKASEVKKSGSNKMET